MTALLVLAITGLAQAGANRGQSGSGPEFEVASVKPGDPTVDIRAGGIAYPPGRLKATNVTLERLIWWAWELQPHQVVGGAGWLNTATWSIEATAAGAVPIGQVRRMMQSLLAERFNLVTHRETRQEPIYRLVVAKHGSRLIEDTGVYEQKDWRLRAAPGLLVGRGVPLSDLINNLTRQLDRQLVDETGLGGRYDFELRFAPEMPPSDSGVAPDANVPSIFTALEEQLGLRLEAAKGPVDMLAIDRAEKPQE